MIQQQVMQPIDEKFHIPADAVNIDDRVKVLNHLDSFAIFDRWGDIHPQARKAQGIFHQGTRFLNRLELRLNKKKPVLLSSSIKEDNDILSVDLTNTDLHTCNIQENSLHISRTQFIRNGVYYEEIAVINYSDKKCLADLTVNFGADFRDLFEIRGINREAISPQPSCSSTSHSLLFEYEGLDNIHRSTEVIFPENEEFSLHKHSVAYTLDLQPHEKRKFHFLVVFRTQEKFLDSNGVEKAFIRDFSEARRLLREAMTKTRQLFAGIITSNEQFNHWIHRSQADLISLLTPTAHGLYPYAGVPWYNTTFGRDGIITAMEVLWTAPEVARDVLLFLSKMQAKELIPSKDAEPGKILHEARSGEMANTGEIPFSQYYGTIDATPLFIMLAGMYYENTGDLLTLEKIWPNIKAGLQWIDEYGDLDKDGFVEYKHKAENGLTNQGWKDSHDSVMYENGQLCEPPIALCEVQGYVYAAKKSAARLAECFHEEALAEQLEHEAGELKRKFNEVFWDAAKSTYALALDGNKQPCRVVSSNPGHCLFTGIVDSDKAPSLARTLLSKEMFSGWGIRTLSEREQRYNPMSYHNGSIWPHDNALIGYGLAKYGLQKEAIDIMSALFDASLFIDMQRLPELYCGFDRKPGEGPTAYPVACSPQAWSVAAVFMLLQACLRIEINALNKTILFDKPMLPEYLDRIFITNLRTGDSFCDVEIHRHQHDVGFNVTRKPEGWNVFIKK